MKKSSMTVEEHLELAKKVREARALMEDIAFTLQKHIPKGSRACKTAFNILYPQFDNLRSSLDHDWHELITDEQFAEYGHIYYKQPEEAHVD